LILKDKIAIVTGSGEGIGRGIALELIKEGAKVTIADINEGGIQETISQANRLGGEATAVQADISSENDINMMIGKTMEKFGRIDILVNNAGIVLKRVDLVDTTDEHWNKILSVNLTGLFKCCRAVLPHMIKNKYGKIVNISSVLGKKGSKGLSAYCASKFGIIGVSKTLAMEVKEHNINVNVICPCRVDTELNRSILPHEDFSKWLAPGDIGRAAVFLCSDKDSKKITGTTLDIFANFGGPPGQ